MGKFSNIKRMTQRSSDRLLVKDSYPYAHVSVELPHIISSHIKAQSQVLSLVIDLQRYKGSDFSLYLEGSFTNVYIICNTQLTKLIVDPEYDINCIFASNPRLELKGYKEKVKSFYTPDSDIIFLEPSTFISFDTGFARMYTLYSGDSCFLERDITQESISCLNEFLTGVF